MSWLVFLSLFRVARFMGNH